MSWDITFCNDLKCTKKDCKRHHLKAHKAFKEGAKRLSFCNEWKEVGCKNYWKEKEE